MRYSFTAEIKPARGGGAYAEVPFDVEARFGNKRPPVKVQMEGETFSSRLVRMGTPCHIVIVPKEIRVKSGKGHGDRIRITVEPDTAPREVVVPEDLRKALAKNKAAGAFFAGLAYTHRKEYARWIEQAKKAETRERRLARALEMMLEGRRLADMAAR